MDLIDECTLLGASLLGAQKFEFSLYGIVSHLSHAYEGKKDKRFSELNAEKFLRGPVEDLKLTLGQLENAFGEKLLLRNNELIKFIEDRNLIAHNYWRLTKTNIDGGEKLKEPELFLKTFIENCDYWQTVLNGYLWLLKDAFAKKENRTIDSFSEKQKNEIKAYYDHVGNNGS